MERNAYFDRAVKTKTVPVYDFGDVTIRKLKQGEVEYVRKHFGTMAQVTEAERYVVAKATVDGNGARVFEDTDQDKLAQVDNDIIATIAEAISNFSGLVAPDPKAQSVG